MVADRDLLSLARFSILAFFVLIFFFIALYCFTTDELESSGIGLEKYFIWVIGFGLPQDRKQIMLESEFYLYIG